MKSVTFVTSNENKFKEFQAILGDDIRRINLELDEIQEMDIEMIIEHKVKQAYGMIKMSVIVEDAGLYLDAWGGFPGPFTKWFDESAGYKSLPAFVPKNNRGGKWVVVYGFYDGLQFKTFRGEMDITVALKPKGDGWGFNNFLSPKGEVKTFSELGTAFINKNGARGKALQKLKKFLKTYNG